jgi:hypothetical protein
VLGGGTVTGCGGLGAIGFGSVPVPLFSCFGFRCCVCLFKGRVAFLVSWLLGFVVWFLGGLFVLFFKYLVYFI